MPYDTLTSEKMERFERAPEEVIQLFPELLSYGNVLLRTDNLRKGKPC